MCELLYTCEFLVAAAAAGQSGVQFLTVYDRWILYKILK